MIQAENTYGIIEKKNYDLIQMLYTFLSIDTNLGCISIEMSKKFLCKNAVWIKSVILLKIPRYVSYV